MVFIVAPPPPPRSQTQAPWGPRFGSAPAYGSKVRVSLPAYPALIPQRTLCASGPDGANSYRASGALPQQPKSGVAGGPGAGFKPGTDLGGSRGCIFERGHEGAQREAYSWPVLA